MKKLLSFINSLYIIVTSPFRWRLLSLYITLCATLAGSLAFVRTVWRESKSRLIQVRK